MEGLDGGFVVFWGEDAVGEEWGDRGKKFGLESLLDSAGT